MVTTTTTTPSKIDIEDVTAKDGSGSFDLLMKSMQEKLDVQYSNNRIKGTDYANACISLLQSTLAQSIEFTLLKDKTAIDIDIAKQNLLLTKAQVSKMGKEEDLIDAQILKMSEDTKLTKAQISKLGKDEILVDAQISKLGKDELMVDAQILKMGEDTKLTQANVTKVAKEVDMLTQQILNATEEVKLTKAKITKLSKDEDLVDAQISMSGEEELLVKAKVISAGKSDLVMDSQVLKIGSESGLLKQKTKTEEAQILGTVDGKAVAGVIGQQVLLYGAQTTGFTNDNKEKVYKMETDMWSVAFSNGSPIGPPSYGTPGSFKAVAIPTTP